VTLTGYYYGFIVLRFAAKKQLRNAEILLEGSDICGKLVAPDQLNSVIGIQGGGSCNCLLRFSHW
jgi:hypothetical protein